MKNTIKVNGMITVNENCSWKIIISTDEIINQIEKLEINKRKPELIEVNITTNLDRVFGIPIKFIIK